MDSDFYPRKCVGIAQYRYFAKQAKKLREENGMTIKEMAEKMECREGTIERLESASLRANLTLERVLDYCRLFEVTPNDLLMDPKNPKFKLEII